MPYKDIEKRRECARKSARKSRLNNPERHKLATKKWINNNRKQFLDSKKVWRSKQDVDYRLKLNESTKRRIANKRRLVIEHYGSSCACCGETEYMFLTIEHRNGNGSAHRKRVGASNVPHDIIKNGYPEEYEVLCYNCNCGKNINKGICPHKNTNSATKEL